jgi:hypothetical protein
MVVAHNKTTADVWDATWKDLPGTTEVAQNYSKFHHVPCHATAEPVNEFRVKYLSVIVVFAEEKKLELCDTM